MLNKMKVNKENIDSINESFNADLEYSKLDPNLKLIVDLQLQRKLAQQQQQQQQ